MSPTYPVAKLRRALVHFVGGRAVQAVARAGLVLLLVRLLPAADYGAYMLIIGLSEMLLQLTSFGLLAVGQRFLPEVAETAAVADTRRFVASITALHLLVLMAVCTLLWLSWEALLPYFGFTPDQLAPVRVAVALLLLVPAFRFVAELLEALLEQGKAQLVRAFMPLGRVLGVTALLAAGAGISLERILLLDCVVTILCLLMAWVAMLGSLRKLHEPEATQPLPVGAMWRHARHMAVVEVVGSTQAPGALRMVIANSLGLVESGLFAFLQSLQRLVGRLLPGVLLRGLVRPMLISRARDPNRKHLLERSMALLSKFNQLAIAAAVVAVLAGGDRLVLMVSGGKFAEAGDTLALMLLVLVLASQRQMVEMLMQILRQTDVLRLTIWLAPVTLAAMWFGARAGLNVAVVVAAAGVGVINAINLWRLRAATGRYRAGWWGTPRLVLPAVAAGVFGHLVQPLLPVWVAVPAAVCVLAALLVLVKPIAQDELRIASRGAGDLAGRALQPLVRKAAA